MSKYLSAEENQKELALAHDKRAAGIAVRKAVNAGQIPAARILECADCSGPAKYYHHESYLREHWLDVIPLCHKCHRARHAKGITTKTMAISTPADTNEEAAAFRATLNTICAETIGGDPRGAFSRALVQLVEGELLLVPRQVYEARGLGKLLNALQTVEDFVKGEKTMDRVEQVNWIDELAGNIASNLWDGSPDSIQAIHEDIQSWGTNSRYMGRGLDANTGEYDANECLAHDLVDYALSDDGRESWDIELPEWFDDHDRRLLTERVAAQL